MQAPTDYPSNDSRTVTRSDLARAGSVRRIK
jgi:hypothetical protein